MLTKAEQLSRETSVRRYKVQYPITDYTFPHDARIRTVRWDSEYLRVELADGRILEIPLRWIPTLWHAAPEEREKYEINDQRTMIVWDPDKCAINEELRMADYLAPAGVRPAE